jgi:hypothetical protein
MSLEWGIPWARLGHPRGAAAGLPRAIGRPWAVDHIGVVLALTKRIQTRPAP